MPEPTENPPNAPTSQPSSTAQNTGTPTTPSAWQTPPNAPAWAQGKTPEQILGIAQQLYSHLEGMTPPTPAAAPAGQNFAQQNGNGQVFDPNEYVTGAQFQQALGQAQQTFLNPLMEGNAQMAWQMAKQEPESKAVFDRFGPEALQYWQRLPANQRTLDGARMVVKLVKGNHFEELAADAIARATGDVSFRSGTGGAPPGTNFQPPLERDEIPEIWRKKAKDLGLEVDDMKKFCEANGMTLDQYFSKYINKTVGAK